MKKGETIRIGVKDSSDSSYQQKDFTNKNDALIYVFELIQTQLHFRDKAPITYTVERF